VSAAVGVIFIKSEPKVFELSAHPVSKKLALTLLGFLILLLAFSPFFINNHALHLEPFGNFVQIGSLVFGGGHVILPLLQSRILSAHLLSASVFARGYFFAQLLPGPLFAVAMYMGASSSWPVHGLDGGIEALLGIYIPGSLLMICALYFWKKWATNRHFVSAISGINAAVLGLLLVAVVDILKIA